jgi:hypothetical protein
VDNLSFTSIDDGEQSWMERDFEEGEVWEVVRNFKGNKAPGLDGFSMEFFQKCWTVLKVDIVAMFQEFHRQENLRALMLHLFVLFLRKLEWWRLRIFVLLV